jgi:hypothetical protein
MTPTLVYLYGPPAVGKLTVATELHALTGIPLFHNHLTIDAVKAVFAFKSPPFVDVVHRLRVDVFETAARHGIDVLFTNNSVWDLPDGRALFVGFAETARQRVEDAGGRVAFVQLTAPVDVLATRVGAPSRNERGKLADPARLRVLLEQLDPAPLHADDFVIDTTTTEPKAAAAAIAARFGLRQ